MEKLGFSNTWCNLVHQCISTVSAAVLLNGMPCEQFVATRGLRQGDPLSAYLFILCMELLSRVISNAEDNILLHGIKVGCNAPPISHLLFADDLLVFSNAKFVEAENILNVLNEFSKSSEQLINLEKSGIFFSPNTHKNTIDNVTRILGVNRISFNDKYLGSPLFTHVSKVKSFQKIIERVEAKLRIGNAKQSLLLIDQLQRDFFWGKDENGKKRCLSQGVDCWCVQAHMGGMGFVNNRLFNAAMLAKVNWRLLKDPDSLWAQIYKHKYYPETNILDKSNVCSPKASWVWKNLNREVERIAENVEWVVGNGVTIKWTWNINKLHQYLEDRIVSIVMKIEIKEDMEDEVVWKLEKNGKFTTKSLYGKMVRKGHTENRG
ncbi:uncharacterized protein LOC113306496 [Papaver somniferum]|uniref:uncharacterized protein LOC113306496 n=1 Tax=Papaver somniferum TaxID=3469 RepID=UPI000E7004B8|nr:uncharacterized protein LOC113306496 [Papaver somniferum]